MGKYRRKTTAGAIIEHGYRELSERGSFDPERELDADDIITVKAEPAAQG